MELFPVSSGSEYSGGLQAKATVEQAVDCCIDSALGLGFVLKQQDGLHLRFREPLRWISWPVEISVDAYKGKLFSGKVALIGAGIVAPAFSIGDFTKTTQRVPVRISLDEGQAGLIPGMSVEVKVRTQALFQLPFGLKSR